MLPGEEPRLQGLRQALPECCTGSPGGAAAGRRGVRRLALQQRQLCGAWPAAPRRVRAASVQAGQQVRLPPARCTGRCKSPQVQGNRYHHKCRHAAL